MIWLVLLLILASSGMRHCCLIVALRPWTNGIRRTRPPRCTNCPIFDPLLSTIPPRDLAPPRRHFFANQNFPNVRSISQMSTVLLPNTGAEDSVSLRRCISSLISFISITLAVQIEQTIFLFDLHFLQILPTAAFPFFFFRTDYLDSPDCLLLLLRISVFTLCFFLFFYTF